MMLCCSIEDSASLHGYDVMRGGGVGGAEGLLGGVLYRMSRLLRGTEGYPTFLPGAYCRLPFQLRC